MPASVKALRFALTGLSPENLAWATGKTGPDGDDHSIALTNQNSHSNWRSAAKKWLQAHPQLEQLQVEQLREIVKAMRQNGCRGQLAISDADVEQVVAECRTAAVPLGPVLLRGEEEVALMDHRSDGDGQNVPPNVPQMVQEVPQKQPKVAGRAVAEKTDEAMRVWMAEDAHCSHGWQKMLAGLKHLKGVENKGFNLAVWLQIEREDSLSVLPANRSVSSLSQVCQPWPPALKDAQTIAEVKAHLKLSKVQADYFELLRPFIFRLDHLRLAEQSQRTAKATSRFVKASFKLAQVPATTQANAEALLHFNDKVEGDMESGAARALMMPEGMEQSLMNVLSLMNVQFDKVVPMNTRRDDECCWTITCRDSDEATTAILLLRRYAGWDAERLLRTDEVEHLGGQ